ncbi:MAG TPA: SHOCT domain-containing protein [Acidimicrobiales bacterium]|nr:SHOCT domain-containing protein [Acidimicrobiales bacterium]
MGDALEAIVVVAGILFGIGGAGVAVAWLHDKRIAALRRRTPDLTPREILERLYAAGEIDDEEFTRRSERLMLDPPLELD